jgi:hypothetical protein
VASQIYGNRAHVIQFDCKEVQFLCSLRDLTQINSSRRGCDVPAIILRKERRFFCGILSMMDISVVGYPIKCRVSI